MNEEIMNVEVIEDAVEVLPAASKISFGKCVKAGVLVGLVGFLTYKVGKRISDKRKAKKAAMAEAEAVNHDVDAEYVEVE